MSNRFFEMKVRWQKKKTGTWINALFIDVVREYSGVSTIGVIFSNCIAVARVHLMLILIKICTELIWNYHFHNDEEKGTMPSVITPVKVVSIRIVRIMWMYNLLMFVYKYLMCKHNYSKACLLLHWKDLGHAKTWDIVLASIRYILLFAKYFAIRQ